MSRSRLSKRSLIWVAIASLGALTWIGLRFSQAAQPGGFWAASIALVCLGGAIGALAYLLPRGLASFPLSGAWRYRLGFLLSAGLPIISWSASGGNRLYPQSSLDSLFPISTCLVGLLAALLGGLAATGKAAGTWENNSPPGSLIEEHVLAWHLAVIGAPAPTPLAKRAFDVSLALVGLLCFSPVWLFSILLLWLEDPGPVLFVKNSVGKGGINFHQFKLRTMVQGAEESTGPVLAEQADQRVLRFGGFLRKTALDELPQLINILRGEMSFVGPRPQRTVLVHEYLLGMPEYAERHRVLPGLAGLAQVAGDYYLTPRQKLRFDRLYIRHSSLGFDLKLLWLAGLTTFWFRWKKDWDSRLPRRYFHKRA